MTAIDIVILALVAIGVIDGFMKGFVKQLATLLGLVAGLVAAKALYSSLAEQVFSKFTDSMTVAQVMAFVAIWIVVPLLFAWAAALMTRVMELISLGWLNRLMGAGLGALKYLLLVMLLISVMEFVDTGSRMLDRTKKQESVLYYPLQRFAGVFFPEAYQMVMNEL